MPFDYRIDVARRLVLSTGQGRVTFADVKAHQDRLLSDPHFDPSFNQLNDLVAVTHLVVSGEQGRNLALRHVFSPASKRAIVAVNPHVFGLARLMQTYHSLAEGGSEVRVFSNLDAALEWLGLKQSP